MRTIPKLTSTPCQRENFESRQIKETLDLVIISLMHQGLNRQMPGMSLRPWPLGYCGTRNSVAGLSLVSTEDKDEDTLFAIVMQKIKLIMY
ncbi:hypothetical protein TNCV_1215571 [Trichonephila clavipes]|nr:hypothetical protein TNCV_1215571 [Trichonephila clavipes]